MATNQQTRSMKHRYGSACPVVINSNQVLRIKIGIDRKFQERGESTPDAWQYATASISSNEKAKNCGWADIASKENRKQRNMAAARVRSL